MTAPKKNPSTPDSLAADGNRGAGASHRNDREAESTPEQLAKLLLASVAIQSAIASLDRYARRTDCPAIGTVEAADHLASARDYLAKAVTP